MKDFNEWLLDVPEEHRSHINAIAVDRNGTVRAFYSRTPVPVFQEWDSNKLSMEIGQVPPMLDDWNHSLLQRPEHPALAWVGVGIAVGCCVLAVGWQFI